MRAFLMIVPITSSFFRGMQVLLSHSHGRTFLLCCCCLCIQLLQRQERHDHSPNSQLLLSSDTLFFLELAFTLKLLCVVDVDTQSALASAICIGLSPHTRWVADKLHAAHKAVTLQLAGSGVSQLHVQENYCIWTKHHQEYLRPVDRRLLL